MQNIIKTSFIVAMLLSAFAGSSIASNWIYLSSGDDFKVFADSQSIQKTGQKVKVWIKIVYDKPQKGKAINPRKSIQSTKQLWAFLCNERNAAFLEVINYVDKQSSSIEDSYSWPDTSSEYEGVPPDSKLETVMKFACDAEDSPKKQ
jgi:hypothetical protein